MNDVKQLCDQVLDTAGPPMRAGAEVLAVARKSRRRARLTTAGSGLAVLAVLAVGAVAVGPVGVGAGPPASGTDAAGTGGPAGTAGLGRDTGLPDPPPDPPAARAAATHNRQLDRVLRTAVPDGYSATSLTTFSDDRTVHPRDPERLPGGITMPAYGSVLVSSGGGEGQLFAAILADGNSPPRELCGPEVTAAMRELPGTACEVLVVDGVPIRVTSRTEEYGGTYTAYRFLRGGFLMVSSSQGRPAYEPDSQLPPDAGSRSEWGLPDGSAGQRPPLARPPLTAPQVAELAADPAMLP